MSGENPAARPRILVVEDEAIVAMLIEDMLLQIGCEVVGPVGSVEKGLARSVERLDGAFLDVNVRGRPVYPVADALIARGVPVVFLTGYGEAGLEERFSGVPVVSKPFTRETLERLVTQRMSARLVRRA